MPLVGQTGLTVANVPGAFHQGQSNAMDMQIKRAQMEEVRRQQAARQMQVQRQQQQNALARQAMGAPSLEQQAKVPLTEDQAMAELLIRNPEMGNDIFKRLGANSQQQRDDAALFAFRASGLNEERQDAFLNQRIKEVEGRGGDASQSKELLGLPYADRQRDLKALQMAGLSTKDRIDIAQGKKSVKRQSFAPQQFTKEDGSIGFGIPSIDPGTGRTTFENVPLPKGASFASKRETVEEVGQKALAREEGKIGAQIKLKPKLEGAIALAKKKATAQGETFTELNQMEAGLPGLVEVTDQLTKLAPMVTHTLGGRAFAAAAKQVGFGATSGSTAKAKFTSLIDNQVLPLLRQTFGAAFTAKEGETLRATMGDVDASPEEKIAQITAFIEQKRRSISTKSTELETFRRDERGDVDLQGMSDDDLLRGF